MNKVYFAMGFHFHQPVGNFGEILERAYQNCYKPFLDTFEKYPAIKANFHFSGNLIDFFEKTHPEYIDKVKTLVDSGRIEIMGGGYYEPIFQAIPKRDRLGQIDMMSGYFNDRFGVKPRGLWVPERVWSPDLVADFEKCGMKYAILDDSHVVRAGVGVDNLYGYFTSRHKEHKIAIFPSDKALRYTIPFRFPKETIDYFRREVRKRLKKALFGFEEKGLPLFVYGDDVEKFGEWPWTYDWVYKKKWLESFFQELTKHRDWVETVKFSDCMKLKKPLKEIEIPAGSYEEMMEWSDGSWMNYLSRYSESNQMHKRMVYVSERLADIRDRGQGTRGKVEEATRELYKGQCNCAYWHGVFGGIYMYHLRSAVFEHLIKSDAILDEIEYDSKNGWANIKKIDFYDWKSKAIICENKDFFVCVDPANGGSIREFDYKKKPVNLINTLTRRQEYYHSRISERLANKSSKSLKLHEVVKVMDKKILQDLFYDKYDRLCLVDHFMDKDLKIQDFISCNYTDKGDFSDNPYVARVKGDRIVLSCEGSVDKKKIIINKEISFSENKGLKIEYILENKSRSLVESLFGMEFNFTLPYADSERYFYGSADKNLGDLKESGSLSKAKEFSVQDKSKTLGLDFKFSEPTKKIWYFPVKTVSQSEKSYDLNYQSSCVLPMWDVKIEAGKDARIEIAWSIV